MDFPRPNMALGLSIPLKLCTPSVPCCVHGQLRQPWLALTSSSATRLCQFLFPCLVLFFLADKENTFSEFPMSGMNKSISIYLLQVIIFAVNLKRNDIWVWKLKAGMSVNKSSTIQECVWASFHAFHDVRYRCFWLQALLWIIRYLRRLQP